MTYRISRKAQKDLEQISDYIAKTNPEAAEQLDAQLHQAMQLLTQFPGMGHTRADVSD
jgi:plasmid stabilization system protein ParE